MNLLNPPMPSVVDTGPSSDEIPDYRAFIPNVNKLRREYSAVKPVGQGIVKQVECTVIWDRCDTRLSRIADYRKNEAFSLVR